MTYEQSMQLATELYRAFDDLCGGDPGVADRLLLLAQLVETNEQTPGGIGDVGACLTALQAQEAARQIVTNEPAARERLRIVR